MSSAQTRRRPDEHQVIVCTLDRSTPSVDSGRNPRRVVVVGCGHVGAVTAACLAHLGYQVAGLDISEELVARLNEAKPPFLESGLESLLATNLSNGRLAFTLDPSVIKSAEYVIICVDTPRSGGSADLKRLHGALETIAMGLKGQRHLPTVVLKSTTPVGTAEGVDFRLRSLLDADIELVLNPEFLRQGSAVADFLQPDRIVIGSNTTVAGDKAAALYCGIDAPIIRTDWRTAEMIKHAANAFLATRVSFINEIASLSAAFGTDIDAIVAGIGVDPRIGSSFLQPGIGFGGSCLPRDLVALATSGLEQNVSTPLLSAVREVNDAQINRARDLLETELRGLKGRRVAAWGATFKQGSEDTRESPAIRVVQVLLEAGATVVVYDPALRETSLLPPGAERGSSALDCCDGADAVVVLTDWPEFREIDLREVARRMNGRLLFDGRNALDPRFVEAAGLTYRGVGRGLSRQVVGRTGDPHD